MRELPPYIYGRECGEHEKVFPLDLVKVIQRQAYEDGLRVAAEKCQAKFEARQSSGFAREASTARALAEEIRAILTASQESK